VKALVTGGAGFIGSHLVDALLRAGHDVVVVDDLSRGKRDQVDSAARFVEAGVADTSLKDLLTGTQTEIVFHLAAQIDVRASVRDPLTDARVNVLGTVNLLDACASADVRRIVFASTGGAIYGDTDVIPTPEDHPCRPQSPYGAAKLCAEAYGATFHRIRGLDFVALRYANVYGPRQDPHGEAGVVAIFAARLLHGEQPVINGDGLQTRDYVYVDDVIAANLAAAESGNGGVFNIGTGTETDVNELFDRLRRIAGSDAEPRHAPAQPGEQRRSCVDVSMARRRLGWEPAVSLDGGLERTLAYFRNV
jgi:UDP-glucose 4-epimerase